MSMQQVTVSSCTRGNRRHRPALRPCDSITLQSCTDYQQSAAAAAGCPSGAGCTQDCLSITCLETLTSRRVVCRRNRLLKEGAHLAG